jgi:hypothetical protein
LSLLISGLTHGDGYYPPLSVPGVLRTRKSDYPLANSRKLGTKPDRADPISIRKSNDRTRIIAGSNGNRTRPKNFLRKVPSNPNPDRFDVV